MGKSRPALVIVMIGLMLTVVSCSKEVTGAARPDPTTVPLALSEDGFGIVAGFDEAPTHIEIFTEPQCTHCNHLQRDFGDEIAFYINIGKLQVTYRPLTFMDDGYNGYSSKVANALFVAAEPAGDFSASGLQLQRFVEELWANQVPGGRAFSGDELRDMALSAGLPEGVADNIAGNGDAVDVAEMEDTNFGLLYDIDPVNPGTPTVYDLATEEKLDIGADNWLDELVES